MTMTQKSLAKHLDLAASRSMVPASPKQCWFLAGLMLKAGEDGSEFVLGQVRALDKRMASDLIDRYLKH